MCRYLTSVRTPKSVPPLGMYELSLSAKAGPAMSKLVEARDGFIRQAVLAAGYRAVTVASFVRLPCLQYQPSAAKRGQGKIEMLGKSDTRLRHQAATEHSLLLEAPSFPRYSSALTPYVQRSRIPLPHDHRPVTRYPPSTGIALPLGFKAHAILGARSPVKTLLVGYRHVRPTPSQ